MKFLAQISNMHMHCHLADCIRDYGPLHAFWVFSFERFNGLLGDQPTNNRSIEQQLMKRFKRDNLHLECLHQANSMPLASEFGETVTSHALSFQSLLKCELTSEKHNFKYPTKYTLTVLCDDYFQILKQLYSIIYPSYSAVMIDGSISLPSTCKKYHHIILNGKKVSSLSEGRSGNVPYVLAKLPTTSGNDIFEVRPVQIEYFIDHSFSIDSYAEASSSPHILSHVFAVCKWPMHHPKRHSYGKPVEVWCKSLYEPTINSLVPIENIISRVLIAEEVLDHETVLVIIPLVE